MRDIWLVNHRIELLGQDSWWWDRKQTRNSLHRIAIMYCGGDTKQWGWQSSHLPHNSDLEQPWFMNLGLATFQQEKTSQSDPITTIILNQLRWRLWSKNSPDTPPHQSSISIWTSVGDQKRKYVGKTFNFITQSEPVKTTQNFLLSHFLSWDKISSTVLLSLEIVLYKNWCTLTSVQRFLLII